MISEEWKSWHEKVQAILLENIRDKHIFLITRQPQKWSYGYEFEKKYELEIKKVKYLVAEIPSFSSENIDILSEEQDFYMDMIITILYNFNESENSSQLIEEVVSYYDGFIVDNPISFTKGDVLFTAYDGEILVIG